MIINQKRTNIWQPGFTLMELVLVIVVLGILSAFAIPRVGNILKNAKIGATEGEMNILKEAIVGTGEVTSGGQIVSTGFKNDVGSSPTSLTDLVTKPEAVDTWNKYLQTGWNGPYLHAEGTDDYLYDAWGNAYVLTVSTITSYGPDGVSGGGDDIVLTY